MTLHLVDQHSQRALLSLRREELARGQHRAALVSGGIAERREPPVALGRLRGALRALPLSSRLAGSNA